MYIVGAIDPDWIPLQG